MIKSLLKIYGNRTSRVRGGPGHRLLVLIYHRVLECQDTLCPGEVYRDKFEWQMQTLSDYFNVLPLAQALVKQSEGTLPARAVSITFDDGYADNYQIALPILSEFGFSATFFIASGYLDGGRMWNDSIIESVRRIHSPDLDLSEFGLGQYSLATDLERAASLRQLLSDVKHLEPSHRERLAKTITSRASSPLPDNLMMTTRELRALSDSGMDIGGHTITHPILANLGADAAAREISQGKQALEEILDRELALFAYPNGRYLSDYTERDIDLVRKAGYTAAVSTEWGVSDHTTDQYQLPRFTPWDSTPSRFMARLVAQYRNVVTGS